MMTLWCISRSPLILGGNLPENRQGDLALETNAEVLAVDQQGMAPRQLSRGDGRVVWVSRAPGGKAWNVAFFNLQETSQPVTLALSSLGIAGTVSVRDLWIHKNLGNFKGSFTQPVPPHGGALFRVTAR